MTSQRNSADGATVNPLCPLPDLTEGSGQAELAGSAPAEPPTATNLAKSSILPRLKGPVAFAINL